MALQVPRYIQTLVPYVPGKPIEETRREFGIRKVLKLASNENPLGPSPKAMAAVRAAVKDLHRYPDAGAYSLKQAISTKLEVSPQSILVGNGSNEVIDMLIRTFCVSGDSIVTSEAAFIAYRLCAQIHGVKTAEVPLGDDLRFDPVAMAKVVRDTERARIVFIANPNNPTGTYLTASELRAFLKKVKSIRGGSVLVALDYAYWEYVTAPDLPDPMELMREFPDNVIVMRTFSKIYGLAGLRIGYGVASPPIISSIEKIRQPFNVNSVALVAAEAALSDRAFVGRSRKLNRQGMKFWEQQLGELKIPFWPSQGNFILADVGRGLDKPGSDVYHSCLKRGVIFRPVANYGLNHALRISIGTPEENRVAAKALAAEKKKSKGGLR